MISSMNSTPLADDDVYVQIVGSIVFVIVWPLNIKLFPLGRPAAALAGASMMVIFSIVSQDEVYEIEGRHGNLQTLFLLVDKWPGIARYYTSEQCLPNQATSFD